MEGVYAVVVGSDAATDDIPAYITAIQLPLASQLTALRVEYMDSH